jgi:transposase-like protein
MTKGEQARLAAWRLKVLQRAADGQNVARVCRRFGISRKSFYKWKRRQAEHGDEGLGDRLPTPRRSPRATPPAVVSKDPVPPAALSLRTEPNRVYLRRFHEIVIAGSSVHRILVRHGMNRLPAKQKHQPHGKRWQRYEKPQPGHRLQLDVNFLERSPGTDAVSINSWRSTTALALGAEDLRRLQSADGDPVHRGGPTPLTRILVVQTDNGAEFQSQFHWHLETRDIRHVYIRPRTPRLNGKVERSHRVDDQEF